MANGKEVASMIGYDVQTSTLYRTMVLLTLEAMRVGGMPSKSRTSPLWQPLP